MVFTAGPYQKFIRQKLDLSALELFPADNTSLYFCTPRGAKIIGRAGVDGIHFCFVRGFGEMVFAISPMNAPGEYVHPVALDFLDFLRMLLACGGTAALEQGWQWSEGQFHDFLWSQLPSGETQKAMDLVEETFHILPMEQPYQYLKKIQSEFDYSRLRFTEDDCDPNEGSTAASTEWKVYFEGGFYGHSGRDKAGSELDIGREFTWNGRYFYIPALYLCSKGLVLDICRRIEGKAASSFNEEDAFSNDQRLEMRRQALDPFAQSFTPVANANGKRLEPSACSSIVWDPHKSESVPSHAMSHYKLDPNDCWVICRWSFPWVTQRKPQLNSLLVTLTEDALPIPGNAFSVEKPGDTVTFSDPHTRYSYTLTVTNLEQEDFTQELELSDEWEYPPYLWKLGYTLTPEPAPNTFKLADCCRSDAPRQKQTTSITQKSFAATDDTAASLCIIGGADGPTAIIMAPDCKDEGHITFSSMHFEPAEKVFWFPAFCKETPDTFAVELL